jgi:hypothetical protein
MKIASKLNRSHLIVSLGSMFFVVIVMYVLGYIKTREGYESPEVLEAELNDLLKEMSKSPVLKGMRGDEKTV